MKKLLLIATLVLSLAAGAQYQDVRERKVGDNRPLAEFVNQHDVLFNNGWKFLLVTKENKNTDFASPQLDDSQWRTLDLPIFMPLLSVKVTVPRCALSFL